MPVARQGFVPGEDALIAGAVPSKPSLGGPVSKASRSQRALGGFVEETRHSDLIPLRLVDEGFLSGSL